MKKVSAALAVLLLAGTAGAQVVAARDGTAGGVWVIDLSGAQVPRQLSTLVAWGAAADEDTSSLYWNNGGTLYRATYTTTGTLSPTSVAMTLAGASVNFTGLAYDTVENKLYGYRNITVPGLYEIDTTTGVATLVFATTSTDFGGFDYDPVTDAFYGLNDTAAGLSGTGLYKIQKPLTAPTFTRLTAYPSADVDIDGLAIGNGRAYFVQDNVTQGIQVYNLATMAYEADLASPFPTGSGTFSAGAWAPGLVIFEDFDVSATMSAPANCSVIEGGTATFVTTANNPGAQGVTNVQVQFTIPAGATFVSSVPAGTPVGNVLTVNLGSLAAQSSATLSVDMTVGVGTIMGSATVSIAETDPVSSNNSASASTSVTAAPPATAAVKGVVSNIVASLTSDVPSIDGAKFSTTGGFDRPFRSPNGQRWIMRADTDLATTADDVLVVSGPGGLSVSAREGDLDAESDTFGPFDIHYGINDAGQFVFSTNTTATVADEVVTKWNGSAFVTVAREGNATPSLPPTTWGATSSSAQIQTDGTVSFYSSLAGATTTTDTAIFRSDGAVVVGQEGVTVSGNQSGGTTHTAKAFDTGGTDGQGFYTNSDGSRYMFSGTINHPTLGLDRVAVVDGNVVIQEGVVLAGSTFSSPTNASSPINYVFMESNGDWFAYGDNDDTVDWALKNGVVIAATDTAIGAGAEMWNQAPYAQTFFLAVGNNGGDYVVGGTTDAADGLANAVLVLNGTTVLMRENDPVDLDNDGMFDDAVHVRTFIDDFAFLSDTDLYIVVRLRTAAVATGCGGTDTDIGQALVRIALPSPCGSADFDGDGDTGTDLDIEAFFACLGGDCCATCGSADFDGDGDTGTDLDIEAFFRVLGGGAC